jgi:hypothetical protein
VLSGDLMTKFKGVTRHTAMPEVPNTFINHPHYKKIFTHLFEYEVYTRLLGRDNDTFSHMAKSEQNADSIGKAG